MKIKADERVMARIITLSRELTKAEALKEGIRNGVTLSQSDWDGHIEAEFFTREEAFSEARKFKPDVRRMSTFQGQTLYRVQEAFVEVYIAQYDEDEEEWVYSELIGYESPYKFEYDIQTDEFRTEE